MDNFAAWRNQYNAKTVFDRAWDRLEELPVGVEHLPRIIASTDEIPYEDRVGFARAMVKEYEFSEPEAVVTFFEDWWKWRREITVWARTGLTPQMAESALLKLEEDEETVEEVMTT